MHSIAITVEHLTRCCVQGTKKMKVNHWYKYWKETIIIILYIYIYKLLSVEKLQENLSTHY